MPAPIERVGVWFLLLYRRLWYGYPFRRIPLSRGFYAKVDPDDYCRLIKHKWYVKGTVQNGFYATRSIKRNGKCRIIWMHRVIMKAPLRHGSTLSTTLKTGALTTGGSRQGRLMVDHINRDTLDNRKSNLRTATPMQNVWNSGPRKNTGKSRYKGIRWMKGTGNWQVRLSVNGRRLSMGCFEDEEEAARAYDEAAKRYYGEFACLNFPAKEKVKGLRSKLRSVFGVLRSK